MRAYHMAINFPLYKEIWVPSLIFWHVFNEKGKNKNKTMNIKTGYSIFQFVLALIFFLL